MTVPLDPVAARLRSCAESDPDTPLGWVALDDACVVARADVLALVADWERRGQALAEIEESRDSFLDDAMYGNHAQRVAYNALRGTRALLTEQPPQAEDVTA